VLKFDVQLLRSTTVYFERQVKAEDMDAYAPKDLLVVTTGSQVCYCAVADTSADATIQFIESLCDICTLAGLLININVELTLPAYMDAT
jgi:hypothetical protein